MTIFNHEIKINFKSFLIWALSIGCMCFAFILCYPGLKTSLIGMASSLDDMGSFGLAFGVDKLDMTTCLGFYATEICILFSLGGAMFASVIGASMLSKEEGGHTSEFLFTLPNSRVWVVAQKFLAMIVLLVVFNFLCSGLDLMAFALIGEKISLQAFLLFHLAQTVMHIEIACICFALSAFSKKVSLGIGIGITFFLYALDMIAKIIPKFNDLKYIIPFYYSGAADIMSSNRLDLTLVLIGIGIAACSAAIGFYKYNKKDLAS